MPPGITYTPIATNELFIAKKNILAPKPENTSIFVLNERELGQQSSILNFLTYEQIIYVQSQRQCYLALKNDNTGTITFKPNHYIDSYEVATDSFSKPLYLYTYTVSSDTNSEFSKTIQVLFKQLLEKE